MYDVIIIGAGVNGAFIARDLAKYQLKILVIEKENDVGDVTSCANSAIIHSGYDPHPNTLKAKLNVLGNAMYDEICRDLDVEFSRLGSLTLAFSDEEAEQIPFLMERAQKNGVPVQLLNHDEILSMEPKINKQVKSALFAPSTGIINPFELVVALMENAMENGVELHLNEEVMKIIKEDNCYKIFSQCGEYSTKVVVNAAGLFADQINNMIMDSKETIIPRKGEYFVLDHFSEPFVSHVLFSIPTDQGKGVLVAPTTSQNYLIGPSSHFINEKDDFSTNQDILSQVLVSAQRMVNKIPMGKLIREFAGLRAFHVSNDFVINHQDGFINVLGMQSPGLASAPATSKMVMGFIKTYLPFVEKQNYKSKRRPLYRLNRLESEERNRLIKEHPSLGNIVCRCEQVSEGEVVDAIHRLCGATSIKGVKKRVRPGAGKCQGGFCEPLIMRILARELKQPLNKINYDNQKSYILLEKTKGGGQHDEL
ncbi:MAG TPA: NAD(P)/FAD-dependent oxidoreductase, partial [Bacilli bacterium]|nr:MAG: L-2-hydroxyglutarate oxidase LhgO [Tenericutes bacterium ADurb.BinA124]HNZ50235.1 NAD(P)/FAD-dependent oxidoreductase [Bacilli bacterium]HPX84898.1 NAD(P)/FAD-dependent oxidoreductase [Bacilli bacterium]